jgi:hypothetical protein
MEVQDESLLNMYQSMVVVSRVLAEHGVKSRRMFPVGSRDVANARSCAPFCKELF